MSPARRQKHQRHRERRAAEAWARCQVAAVCDAVQTCGVPVVHVTRRLGLSERTVRRWRRQGHKQAARRGRPPLPATRDERCAVYRFLKQRGPSTPLAAVRVEFPTLRVADLRSMLKRYRRLMRRKALRRQSRLEWRRAGAVWAADFKERREPLEGRYGWILSIKDLGSGSQLAWQPLVQATAECVQEVYAQLFAQHGPPLVLKSDNGGQFKADDTKALLAEYHVLPLYSPKRRPAYNGGVERANGQVASYQEAIAAHHQRPAGPTCDDAEAARQMANDLSRPHGWQGPTARQLFAERVPLTFDEREAFLATVEAGRVQACAHWNLPLNEELSHYVQAAVDRRAIRDALVAHGLLVIHPKRKRRGAQVVAPTVPLPSTENLLAPSRPVEDRGALPANPSEPSAVLPVPAGAGADSGACDSVPAFVLAAAGDPGDRRPLPAPALAAYGVWRDKDSLPACVLAAPGAGTMEEAMFERARPTVGRANLWRRLLRQALHLIRGGPFLR